MKTKLLNLLTYFKRKPKTVTKDLGAIVRENNILISKMEDRNKDQLIQRLYRSIAGHKASYTRLKKSL